MRTEVSATPNQHFRHVFGPVPSRRLGRSLGIDLVPFKTCSYDCVYCQLGRTTRRTCRRGPYVSAYALIAELNTWLSEGRDADYLTISGSGEPTLNQGIGHIVSWLKDHSAIPLAVLTNGSLLCDDAVRKALRVVDVLIPSLDAAINATFQRLNRPHPSVRLGELIEGLKAMRQELQGEIWLEVMLVRGFNDTVHELEAIAEVVEQTQPNRVQINTVVRPPADGDVGAVDQDAMNAAKEILGPRAEVIAAFHTRKKTSTEDELIAERILALLQRRPCTLSDVAEGLSVHPNWVVKPLEALAAGGRVRMQKSSGETYYVADAVDVY